MKLVFKDETGEIRQVKLAPSGAVIGRGTTADIVLSDPRASRQHCRIVHASGIWLLEDLGSTNGVMINGVRTAGSQVLAEGDRLGIGNSELFFLEDRIDAMTVLGQGDIPPTVRIPVPCIGDPRAETQRR